MEGGLGSGPTVTSPVHTQGQSPHASASASAGAGAGAHPCAHYQLVVVGHSLGAAAAAILALTLRPLYARLHCYAYGVPGCVFDQVTNTHTSPPRLPPHSPCLRIDRLFCPFRPASGRPRKVASTSRAW